MSTIYIFDIIRQIKGYIKDGPPLRLLNGRKSGFRSERSKWELLHENERDIYGSNSNRCLDLTEILEYNNLKMTFDPGILSNARGRDAHKTRCVGVLAPAFWRAIRASAH